ASRALPDAGMARQRGVDLLVCPWVGARAGRRHGVRDAGERPGRHDGFGPALHVGARKDEVSGRSLICGVELLELHRLLFIEDVYSSPSLLPLIWYQPTSRYFSLRER